MTLRSVLPAALLLVLPGTATAFSVEGIETLVLGCFAPPGLAPHPTDPDVVFVPCSSFPVGVFAIRVAGAPFALDSRFPPFFLPSDLNGEEPDPPQLPFIDDVIVERSDLAWVTTSNDELVVPWDPSTGAARAVRFEGAARLSIPTAVDVEGTFTRTDGGEVSAFRTSFTSGFARVGGRILVATSNFASFGASPVLYPGTVLLFDVTEDPDGTLVVSRAEPPWLITTDPNPTAVTVLPGGLVAVTSTGALDLRNPPAPAGPGGIDIVDPERGAVLANVPLGESSPSFREIAVDPGGAVGIVGSAVYRELYAVDLRGLAGLPVPDADPAAQRPSCHPVGVWETAGVPCLRERVLAGPGGDLPPPVPIPVDGRGRDGFVAQVRFGPGGVALATAFNSGRLAAVRLELDGLDSATPFLAGRLGEATTAFLTEPLGSSGAETGPGPFAVLPGPGGLLEGSTVVWVTNGPDGTIMRGTVTGSPHDPGADSDGDGIADPVDPCPRTPGGSVDRDGDGAGDACDLCPDEPNPRGYRLGNETRRDGQRDDDGDGHGNACDAEMTADGVAGTADLAAIAASVGRRVDAGDCGAEPDSHPRCAAYDLDERGERIAAGDLLRGLGLLGTIETGACPGCALPCAGPACP